MEVQISPRFVPTGREEVGLPASDPLPFTPESQIFHGGPCEGRGFFGGYLPRVWPLRETPVRQVNTLHINQQGT